MNDSKNDLLDDELRAFLRAHVANVEQLEILRLLVERRGESLARDALGAHLSIRPAELRGELDALAKAGLVVCESTSEDEPVTFAPTSRELDERACQMIRVWKSDQLGVLRFMNEMARERADSLVSRLFAEAFILKRK